MAGAARSQIRHYDTIVIGAGISGLSCAARLYSHPFYKVKDHLLVLEARNRLGGRIGSVTVNGNRLDTGANWIHGVGTANEPNPLMGVLPHKRYRELSNMVAFKAPDNEKLVKVRDGATDHGDEDWVHVPPVDRTTDRVIPADVSGPLHGALWGMVSALHETAVSTPPLKAKTTTMLHAITNSNELQEAYRSVPTEYKHTFSAMPQFIEGTEAAPLVAQSAEQPKGRPGFSLLEFAIDDFGGDQVFLQDGYTAVIDEISKELVHAALVETGVKVKQIRWDERPIVLETSEGRYSANEVVCSLPLGVLQHASQESTVSGSLFEPSLPPEKQQAIDNLGFGTLDKIFLVYQEAWWEAEPYSSIFEKGLVKRSFDSEAEASEDASEAMSSFDTLFGFTTELPGVEIHQDGTTSAGVRALMVLNHQNITGFPVLSAFISCSNAVHVEGLTDDQAGDILHRALTSWLGREPPKPDAVHVTRWAQDEYSRGSYSHMITGLSETIHREAFQAPVVNDQGGILRFAGEHTSRNHFATVHGALLSGWREADDILRHVAAA